MPSTAFLKKWKDRGIEDADPKVDIYASFGYDAVDHQCTRCSYTAGLATLGGACKDGAKNSMNEYARTPAQSAWVQ